MRLMCCVLISVLFASGCEFFAKLAPQKSGDGVIRLSARTAGALLKAINDDVHCGFKSSSVIHSIEGQVGSEGTAILRVENCVLDYPEKREIMTTCLRERAPHACSQTFAEGKATVTAELRIKGRLTGNPQNPAVPSGPDSVETYLEATFDNFKVSSSADPYSLTAKEGRLSFLAEPHLAKSPGLQNAQTRNLCVVPTANIALKDFQYEGAKLYLDAGWMRFNADVAHSNVSMQIGPWINGKENHMEGSMTIWGKDLKVPGDGKGVDPDYDPEKFATLFDINSELTRVTLEDFQCGSFMEKLAHGVGGLSALVYGQVVENIDSDFGCGFASPDVIQQISLKGVLGKEGGKAKLTLLKPCTMDFVTQTPVAQDKQGVTRYLKGRVTVSGSKTLRGRLVAQKATLQQALPAYAAYLKTILPSATLLDYADELRLKRPEAILPSRMEPVKYDLDMQLDNFTVYDLCTQQGDLNNPLHCTKQARWKDPKGPEITLRKGKLEGEVVPILGREEDDRKRPFGFCAVKTPIAHISHLRLSDADAHLVLMGNTFDLHVENSEVEVFAGIHNGQGNRIKGKVEIDGVLYEIPAKEREEAVATYAELDPDYDEKTFLDSFQYGERIHVPKNDVECDGMQSIAENAARLIVQNVGGIVASATAPTASDQGFANVQNLLKAAITGNTTKFVVKNGHIAGKTPAPRPILDLANKSFRSFLFSLSGRKEADCLGNVMWREGRAWYAGSMTVHGQVKLDKELLQPDRPDGLEFDLTQVNLFDFAGYEIAQGQTEPMAKLVVHQGKLSVRVIPILGESRKLPGVFSIQTPIAKMENIRLQNADATIVAQGMEIKVHIDDSDIDAFNGIWNKQGNYLRGSITIDGRKIQLNAPLIPNYPEPYDPIKFTARYVCNPDLKSPIY